MSSNFNFPFQRGTESLPTEPNQRLGGVRQSGAEPNDEFTLEVMERNSALIDDFINISREMCNLSGLDIYQNHLQYPEFDAHYINQFGKEHINVVPRAERPKKESEVEKEDRNPLCLMVLYDNNRIAAIELNTLNVLYTNTLASTISNEFVMMSQYQITNNIGISYSSLDFSDNMITKGDKYQLHNIQKMKSFKSTLVTEIESNRIPILNFSGTTIFTSLESITYSDDKFSLDTILQPLNLAYCISSTSEFFYYPTWNVSNISVYLGMTYFINDTGDYKRIFGEIDLTLDSGDNTVTYLAPKSSAENVTTVLEDVIPEIIGSGCVYKDAAYTLYVASRGTGGSTSPEGNFVDTSIDSDFSGGVPYPIYSNNKKVDSIDVNLLDVIGNITANFTSQDFTLHYYESKDLGPPPNWKPEDGPYYHETVAVANHVNIITEGELAGTYGLINTGLGGPTTYIEVPICGTIEDGAGVHAYIVCVPFRFVQYHTGGDLNDIYYEQRLDFPSTSYTPHDSSQTLGTNEGQFTHFEPTESQNDKDVNPKKYRIYLEPFPPSLGTRVSEHFLSLEVGTNTGSFVHSDELLPDSQITVFTPYGQFNGGKFRPWLHVSNGKDFIQGFIIGDEHYLYLNSERIDQKLATKLNTSPINLICMFMDIPLNRIRQFK